MPWPIIFAGGLVVGAITWALSPLLSGKFEPFDSGLALSVGQALMSAYGGFVGYRYRISRLVWAILGMYLGQVGYWYVFGSSDARAWVLLGAFTTLFLCAFPALAGILGIVFRGARRKKEASS